MKSNSPPNGRLFSDYEGQALPVDQQEDPGGQRNDRDDDIQPAERYSQRHEGIKDQKERKQDEPKVAIEFHLSSPCM